MRSLSLLPHRAAAAQVATTPLVAGILTPLTPLARCARTRVALIVTALACSAALIPIALHAQTTSPHTGTSSTTGSTATGKQPGNPGSGPGLVTPMISGTGGLMVSPEQTSRLDPASTTRTYTFTVSDTGTVNVSGSFRTICSGAVSGCSASPTSGSVPHGGSISVTVTYTTGASGTGIVQLQASCGSGNNAFGELDVTLPTAPPLVTAAASTVWTAEKVSTNYPSFTVKNNGGNVSAAYTLSATCGGNVSGCSVGSANPTASLAPNASTTAQVNFSVGPASSGNGTVTLTATSPYGETSSQAITIVPLSEDVSVTTGTAPTPPQPSQTATYPFTIAAVGTNTSPITYTLSTSCAGALTCGASAASPTTVTISPGSPASALANVTATSSLAGGSGTVALTASYTNSWGQTYANTASYTVTVPDIRTYTAGVSAPSGTTYYFAEQASTSYTFSVTNSGNTQATYTLSVPTCTGTASGCTPSQGSVTLAPGASANIPVSFTMLAAGQNGSVALAATYGSTSATSPTVTLVPLSEAVQVTPDGATTTLVTNGTTTVPFTVHETGNAGSGFNYTLTVSCSGSIVGCTFVSTGTNTMTVPPAPGVDQTVQVTLHGTSSLAGGSGAVNVTATYNNGINPPYTDQGSYGTTIPDTRTYTPQLTPKGDSTTYNEANVATNAVFTVKNVGNTQATYTITQPTACTGQASGTSCIIRSGYTSLTLAPGANSIVPVDYTTGPLNQRVHISLEALASAGAQPTDTGSIGIVPLSDTVTVVAASGTPTVLTNASGTYNFTVTNVGNNDNVTYTLQLTGCSAPVVNCGAANSVTLNHGQSATIPVTYQTQSATETGQIGLRAFIQQVHLYQAGATGSITVSSRLAVSTAFMNNVNQDLSLCANACYAVTAARSTVPYYTLDTPRSVTLAYNSDRAFPRPFVYADVSFLSAPPTGTTTYRLQVQRNGVYLPFTNGETTLTFQNSSSGGRLAGQLDLSADTTGVESVFINVTAVYSDGTSDNVSVPARLLVVNTSRPASGAPGAFVAKGWSVAGVPRLSMQSDSSALITDGTGSALVFRYVNHAYVTPAGDTTTLTQRPGGGWVRTALDKTAVSFRANGLADSVSDRLGFATVFEYDASNRLSKIHDPMLRKTRPGNDATVLTYGTYGLASIQEPNPVTSGRVTGIYVRSDSMLTKVVDPDGDSTHYGYDTSARLDTTTSRSGATITYIYGTDWKLSQIVSPQVDIDGSTKPQQPTVTFHPWQSVGAPTDTTVTTAKTPATPISIAAPTASVTDPVGAVTQMTVDSAGRPLTVTDPVGSKTQYQYTGPFVGTVNVSDPNAGVSYYNYSGSYLTSVVQAGADTVNYHYGVDAQVDSIWGHGVLRQHAFLRSDGRPDSVQVGSATAPRTTVYTYATIDTLTKRPVQITDPAGHVTRYAYDPIFGNTQVTTAPVNRADSVWFDAYGRDTLSKTPAAGRVVHYDAVNRPTRDSIVGNPGVTRYAYAKTSTTVIDSVIDAAGNVYQSDYNVLGWKIADHSPNTSLSAITYRYDLRGLHTSTTNRRGYTITMTYDPVGRMHTRIDPLADTTTFTYSPAGFTVTATNRAFSERTVKQLFCTSPSGHAVDQTCQNDTTVVTYNRATYTIGHADPGNFADTATSTLDDGATFNRQLMRNGVLGVPSAVTLGPLSMNYAYDAADGLRTQTTLPALGTMADSFTTNHEVYWRQYSDATVNATFQRAYHYDLAGRLDSYTQSHNGLSTASEIRRFGYDAAGRFAVDTAGTVQCNGFPASGTGLFDRDQGWQTSCGTPAGTTTYQYDAVGNRTHTIVNGADTQGWYTVDRVDSIGTRTYGYDADGNTTSMSDASTGEARQYYYDASGLLDSVAVTGGPHPGTLRLGYDPYGRLTVRSWTTSGGASPTSERLYLYDGDNVGKEIDLLNGGAATDYAYDGTDHPIMRVVHDATGAVTSTTTYLYDEIGRVEGAITNGVATGMENYDDWGHLNSGPALSTLRFGFKGMLYDEDVDLYYARNRWYDPKIGRFTQEDPIGLAGGINQYAFANNDPINGADPSGLMCSDLGYQTAYQSGNIDYITWHTVIFCFPPRGGPEAAPSQPPDSPAPGGPGYVGGGPKTPHSPRRSNPACTAARTTAANIGRELSRQGELLQGFGLGTVGLATFGAIVAPEALPLEAGGAELGAGMIDFGGGLSTLGAALTAFSATDSFTAGFTVAGARMTAEYLLQLAGGKYFPGVDKAMRTSYTMMLTAVPEAMTEMESACGTH